jgi:hypothetical protein
LRHSSTISSEASGQFKVVSKWRIISRKIDETLNASANNILRTFSVPLIVVPETEGLDVGANKCLWTGIISDVLTFDVGTVDVEVAMSIKAGEFCTLPLCPGLVNEIGVALFVLP